MGSIFRSAANLTKKLASIPRWQRRLAKKAVKKAAGYGERGKMTTHDAVDSLSKVKEKKGGIRDYLRVGASVHKLYKHGKQQSELLPPAEDYDKWPKELRDRLEAGQRAHAQKRKSERKAKSGTTRTTTRSQKVNVSVQVTTPHPRKSRGRS